MLPYMYISSPMELDTYPTFSPVEEEVNEVIRTRNIAAATRLIEQNINFEESHFFKIWKTFPSLIDELTNLHPHLIQGCLRNVTPEEMSDLNHTIRELLERGADYNTTGSDGFTFFQRACSNGFSDLVSIILDYVAYTNGPEEILPLLLTPCIQNGMKPLEHAMATNQSAVIELLLNAINSHQQSEANGHSGRFTKIAALKNLKGYTPLMLQAALGDINSVQRLLQSGENPRSVDKHGNTLLHYASIGGNTEIVEIALGLGLDINSTNQNDETPLLFAAKQGHVEATKFLLAYGANVLAYGLPHGNFLHHAAAGGSIEIIHLAISALSQHKLRDVDTPLESKNDFDKTALLVAAVNGHLDACNALIALGARTNAVDDNDENFLHAASRGGKLAIIEVALASGLSIESVTLEEEYTPLLLAASCGHKEAVWMLIAHGARIDATNSTNDTLLHIAAYGGNHAIVDSLIREKRFTINLVNDLGESALYQAALAGHLDIVKLLVDGGADTTICNSELQESLLHGAIRGGNAAVIIFAIRQGCDIEERNAHELTPLLLAAASGNYEAAFTLVAAGANTRAIAIGNNFLKYALEGRNDKIIQFAKSLTPQESDDVLPERNKRQRTYARDSLE